MLRAPQLRILAAFILLAALACAQSTSRVKDANLPPVVRAGYVQLADNTYRNDVAGFSFKLPAGWVVSTDVAGSVDGSTHTNIAPAQSGALYLLRAAPAGVEDPPTTVYVMAEELSHLPDIKSPLSYLSRLNNALSKQQIRFMGAGTGFSRDGRKTYRAFYGRAAEEKAALYYSMDVVLLEKYAVVFMLCARDSS